VTPDVTQQTDTALQAAFDAAAAPRRKKPSVLRRIRKGAAAVLLAGTALSTVLQFTPCLVATPADDYLAQKGFSTATLDAFQAKDIHIYDRDNPLVPFHMAGHRVRTLWSQENESLFDKVLGAPIILGFGFHHGMKIGHQDSKLAAYSFSTEEADAAVRSVFVWPSDDAVTPEEWLAEMTGLKAERLDFGKHSHDDMQRILIETGLLHEMRHGDQIKSDNRTLKESDADAYSLHAAALGSSAPSLRAEARAFITAARAVAAVTGGDGSHASALALQRGMENDFMRRDRLHDFTLQMRAHEDGTAFISAHYLLRGVLLDNIHAVPADMDLDSAFYHAASALLDAGAAQRDNEKDAISIYVHAMDYLDSLSGGKLIDRRLDHRLIEVGRHIPPPEDAPETAPDLSRDNDDARRPPRQTTGPHKIPDVSV